VNGLKNNMDGLLMGLQELKVEFVENSGNYGSELCRGRVGYEVSG